MVERRAGVQVERPRVIQSHPERELTILPVVFFVGVVLLSVAAAVYSFTDLLVAAAPMVMLASGVAIASVASHASRRVVGQWGGAGGAVCEDHLALALACESFAWRGASFFAC